MKEERKKINEVIKKMKRENKNKRKEEKEKENIKERSKMIYEIKEKGK